MPGSTGWGGNYWGKGTWGLGIIPPVAVYEGLALSEGLTVWVPLRVEAAQALTTFRVEITFSHDLDFGYAPLLTPSNYSIPGLTVDDASPGHTSKTVRLTTSEQGASTYTVTVTAAESYAGDPLDPNFDEYSFPGFPIAPTFFAAAQSRTKVQLIFSTEMLQNAEFSDPASYQLTTLGGTPVAIASAAIYGPTPVRRLDLTLGADLEPGGHYVLTILDPAVQTAGGLPIYPTTDLFQWAEAAGWVGDSPLSIAIDEFSGEVSGGLLGQPLGQVFFSPALEASAANSSIQLDEVAVCTRAYDTYTFPELPDPEPLMTYGGAILTTIGDNVLWAPAPRLGLATFTISDLREDTLPTVVDGPADATLQETFDQSKVALLNVEDWVLYDGVGTSFICADNLAPVGPGATTNINLQP